VEEEVHELGDFKVVDCDSLGRVAELLATGEIDDRYAASLADVYSSMAAAWEKQQLADMDARLRRIEDRGGP
jgi:hypothetical protein